MMMKTVAALLTLAMLFGCCSALAEDAPQENTILYQGHGSLRVTTAEGKVIYIDPYAGEGYDAPADLILVTHGHPDHNAVNLIKTKNPDCVTITYKEALAAGEYQQYDLGFVKVEAVQAESLFPVGVEFETAVAAAA